MAGGVELSRRQSIGLLFATALTGCSGGAGSGGAPPVSEPGPTPTPVPTPAPSPTPSNPVIATLTADFFVDFDSPPGGDGRTRATAVQSFAALLALPGFGAGATVAVKGGTAARRDGLLTYHNQLTFIAYDGMVVLDGTDIAPAAAFAPHPSLANCYVADWSADYQATNSWCRIWYRGVPLKRRRTEAEVAATPNTYTVGDHGTIVPGEPVRIVAHFPGGVNPASDGGLIEITRRECALLVGDDCLLHGFHGRRFASHNGAFRMGRNARASRLLSEEGTTHNWVFGDGVFDDIAAVNCASDEYAAGCIMGTNFVDGPAAGKAVTLNRPLFIIDRSVYGNVVDTGAASANGYYCHGTGGLFASVTVNDGVISGARGGFIVPALEARVNGALIEGMNDSNSVGISEAGHTVVRKGLFLNVARLIDGPSIDVEGAALVTNFRSSGAYFWHIGGTGVQRIRLVDSYMIGTGGFVVATDAPALAAEIRGNIVDGADWVYDIAGTSGGAINNNVYSGGAEGALSFELAGSAVEFPAWQGAGFDANSVSGDPRWLSGRPTPARVDLRLGSNSPALGRVGTPVDQNAIAAYLARPRTLAQAKEYLLYRAPMYAVA